MSSAMPAQPVCHEVLARAHKTLCEIGVGGALVYLENMPEPSNRAKVDSFSMSFADPPAATTATLAADLAGLDWGSAIVTARQTQQGER